MSEKNRYLDIIKNQRSTKTKKKFSGTLLDYLQLVEKDPTVTDHAHKRLWINQMLVAESFLTMRM